MANTYNSGTHYRARVHHDGQKDIYVEPKGFLSREAAKTAALMAQIKYPNAQITVQYGHLGWNGKFDYWKDDVVLNQDGSFVDVGWLKRTGYGYNSNVTRGRE